VASDLFEFLDAIAKSDDGGIGRRGVFDLGDERRAYNRGIGEAAEDADVAGERNAEADGDGKIGEVACAA
jgi:hypothetical protein